MSVVMIERQVVHYEVLGRGRPLIFLHGWVGSWRYWIPAMQAASTAYRAYALDLWGFGDTAKFSPNYALDRQASLIDRFLNELGVGRVALVGHGLGAAAAVLYAARCPEVVDRVMAVSLPCGEARLNPRLREGSPADLAGWLLERAPASEPVLTDAPKTDPQAAAAALSGAEMSAAVAAGRRLPSPCLLVSGKNDPAVIPPGPDDLLDLPPQAHAITFDQSGHFPMLDEASRFNRLMIDFLSLPSGASPRELQLKEEWKRRVR